MTRIVSCATAWCALLLCGATAAWGAGDDSPSLRAERLVSQVCSSCHRSPPASSPALVPTLAGQHETYLVWQLRAYRLGFRDDPQAHDRMWSPAAKADDALIEALAGHYAAQAPAPGTPGDAALIARGKALYEGGVPARKVTDCASCHGPAATGNGMFPRLAGQRADYLVREISLIQLHLRNVGIMHSTVEGLSDDEIKALAAYLQSL
jgi:cytochrome c553